MTRFDITDQTMTELLYHQNSFWIIILLAGIMALAIESGYRIGRRDMHRTSELSRNQINTIQSSLLGILALILGFTFSIALDRYNSRSSAEIAEANAIGTAYLRSELLPESVRPQIQSAIKEYLSVRMQDSTISLDRQTEREALLNRAVQLQTTLWDYAIEVSTTDPNPVTSGLFVQSLNEMIDNYSIRLAEINRHIPEFVLVLLYSAFIVTGGMIGYTAGLADHRPAFATYIMVMLIILLLFMVIDLDRPRSGIIQVSQQGMIELNATINKNRDLQ
jgi:hypothetical protein